LSLSFINADIHNLTILQQVGKLFFWTAIVIASLYFYLDNAVAYLFGYRSERFGDSLFKNQIWFVTHIVGATFSLFLGPIQFWRNIRNRFIKYHRFAGKLYIIGSLAAGISPLKLSFINDCIGCRYPLFILSVLFILSTSLAWYSIKMRNIIAHKQFMIRSYTCALAFVFVRLYQILPVDILYADIEDINIRRTVNEWMFSFVPLILVEIFMIWIPSLRIKRNYEKPS